MNNRVDMNSSALQKEKAFRYQKLFLNVSKVSVSLSRRRKNIKLNTVEKMATEKIREPV